MLRKIGKFTKPGSAARFSLAFMISNVLVTALVSLLLSVRAPSQLRSQSIDLNRDLLLQTSRAMDTTLMQANLFLQQIAMDESLKDVPDYHAHKDMEALLSVNDRLNTWRLSSNFVLSLAVYYPDRDGVFIPNMGYLSIEDSPDGYINQMVANGKIQDGWLPARNVLDPRNDTTVSVISIVKFLSPRQRGRDPFVIINVNEDYLRYLAAGAGKNGKSDLLLLRSDGSVFSSLTTGALWSGIRDGKAEKAALESHESRSIIDNRTRMLVTVEPSNFGEWKYVSIIPLPVISRQLDFLRWYSLGVFIIGIAMSLYFSLLFSRRFNVLLSNLIRAANQEDQREEEDLLESLEATILQMRERSIEMEDNLREQMPILRNNALEALIKNRFPPTADLSKILSRYGFALATGDMYYCAVAAFPLDDDGEAPGEARDLSAVVVTDTIRAALPTNVSFVTAFTRDDELVMLFGYPETAASDFPGPEAVREIIERNIGPARGSSILIGISLPRQGLTTVHQSYREARAAIVPKDPCTTHDECKKKSAAECVDYSFEDEESLTQALKNGDAAAVGEIHARIFGDPDSPSPAHTRYAMLNATLRAATMLGIAPHSLDDGREPYDTLMRLTDYDAADAWFRGLYTSIIKNRLSRKKTKNHEVAEKVAEYIRNNYQGDVSLYALSCKVYLSEAYLSKLFHAEMGTPIKQYIGGVRVERAKECLSSTTNTVADIGRSVGYENSRAFIKFFKEQTGLSPNEYRCFIGKGA